MSGKKSRRQAPSVVRPNVLITLRRNGIPSRRSVMSTLEKKRDRRASGGASRPSFSLIKMQNTPFFPSPGQAFRLALRLRKDPTRLVLVVNPSLRLGQA